MGYEALQAYYGESLKTKSKDDRIFFINSLKTFDPRTKQKDLQFELYPFQIDYVKKLFQHIDDGRDLFVEKSRDMGVSWTTCAVILWYFLFEDGFQCLIGSRKEDYVDNKTIDSLFGKLDYLVKSLPWKIQGYKEDKHRLFMKLSNPENGSNIQGESANANFSRGGRYKCLTGDTLISTAGGLLTIKEMVESGKRHFVTTKDFKIKEVTRFLTNAPEKVYEVKTKYGYSIKGTRDHRLLTQDGYKPISELSTKDSLILTNLVNTSPEIDHVTPLEAKIMGWLVSEGAVSSKSHIQFTQKEKYLVEEFISDFEKAFNRTMFLREIERDFSGRKTKWWVAERSCMDIRERLSRYGLTRAKAADKEIPSLVLTSSDVVLKAFLQSLYEGDGSVGKYGGRFYNQIRVSYTTKSQKLARQVQIALLRFGIVAGIKKDKRRNIFQVDCNGVDAQLFLEKVGFLSDRKNYYNGSQKKFFKKPLSQRRELPIVSIEEVGEETTYDFEVPDEHNFIANGLVSHNCVFFDEMAFWPYQEPSWTSAGDATPCRIAVTTPSPEPTYAKSIRNSGLTELYTLHWHLHPLKTQQWYEEEKKRRTPEEIARELDINWEGALTGIVYPEVKNILLDNFPLLDAPVYCSWDFGLDGVAILWWQKNPKNMKWRLYQSYFNQEKPISFYFPFFGKQIDSKYSYTQKDFDVMETVKDLPPATHFGDPDVDKRSILTGTSTKEALAEANIYVQTNRKANDFESRKTETKLFLMKSPEINDTPTNRYFIDCIRSAHYPQRRETSQAVTPVRLPVHDNSCLVGETKIRTLSGWHEIKELVGKDFYVWGYSHKEKRLIPTKARRCWKTGTNRAVIEIGLDSGRSIKCTPEHLFMLRTGDYLEAENLQVGQSLMPFYERGNSQDYPTVDLNDGSRATEHQYVYSRFNGFTEDGYHIHHKDGDKFNNNPDNLEKLDFATHCSITRPADMGKEKIKAAVKKQNAKSYFRMCPICNTEVMMSYKQKYCSKECQKKAWQVQRNLDKLQRDGLEKVCAWCGKKFIGFPRQMTCSLECAQFRTKNYNKTYLSELKRGRRPRMTELDRFRNHKVRYIRHIQEKSDVYDIEVPETHNFVAEGVVIHNSHPRTALEYFCVNIADLKDEPEFVTFDRGDSITGYGAVSKGYKSVGTYEDYATFGK